MTQLCVLLMACCGLFSSLVAPGYANPSGWRAPRITEHPSDITVAKDEPVTLQCSADGDPAPQIEWYRDGELVASSSTASSGRRMLLPGGALFFLSVIVGRKETDAGVYWCVARNAIGASRSRNATLSIINSGQDFRAIPQHTRGILGETVVLECERPKGFTSLPVRWRKNGQPLELELDLGIDSDRIRVEESGSLVISRLTQGDEGRYQCIAQNSARVRETPPVLLSVHARPEIIRPPFDITTLAGSDVTFECLASGDPAPQVVWRKHEGSLPAGRARLTESRTGLRIERVSAGDSGRYICEVENSVGSASAWAELSVLVPPTWDWTNSNPGVGVTTPVPKELRVQLGQTVTLDCAVSGVPAPLVLWSREGRPQPEVMTSSSDARWTVLSNGTLVIRDIRREDSGSLWCAAVNEGGSLFARTRLEISSALAPPPVVIEIGPANQTLPLKSPASLPCQAEGHPVRWTKDGIAINATFVQASAGLSRPRISVDDLGTLRIEDLQLSDSGSYSCITGKDDQVSVWTASLSVASPTNPNVGFFRSPSDPMALPGSPSQPRLLQRTPTTLTIGWQSGSRMGASPLLGYTVEVFSSAQDETQDFKMEGSWTWAGSAGQHGLDVPHRSWRIIASRLKADTLTLTDLKPSTSYTFLVRAENSHGLSLPSPVSQWFVTLPGSAQAHWKSAAELEETRQRLTASWVRLEHTKPLNSTAIKLTWHLLDGDGVGDGESSVEGLYLWYRQSGDAHTPYQVATIVNPAASGYTVTQLKPHAEYVFFLVPFFRNVEGKPSNTKRERTMEAVPSGYPLNITIRHVNSTSVLVNWNPPDAAERNGVISAYQILVSLESSEAPLANMTLPADPTSVVIGGLVTGSAYQIRAAAWTTIGMGPTSPAAPFKMEASVHPGGDRFKPQSNEEIDPLRGIATDVTQVVQETWFIMLLGGVLLALLCLLITALVVRRNLARKKALSSVSKADCDDQIAGAVRGRDLMWTRGWQTGSALTKEMDPDTQTTLLPHMGGSIGQTRTLVTPPEYAELLGHPQDQQLSLSSFLPRRALPNQPPAAYATTTLVTHRTNHPPYAMTGITNQHLASDSSTSSYTTDEHGDRYRRAALKTGSRTNVKGPNLNEMFPPPRCPPPPSPAPGREVGSKMALRNGSPMNGAGSPALSKRGTPLPAAPVAGGTLNGSSGSHPSAKRNVEIDSSEYAYAYHTPLDIPPSGALPPMAKVGRVGDYRRAGISMDRAVQSSLCSLGNEAAHGADYYYVVNPHARERLRQFADSHSEMEAEDSEMDGAESSYYTEAVDFVPPLSHGHRTCN